MELSFRELFLRGLIDEPVGVGVGGSFANCPAKSRIALCQTGVSVQVSRGLERRSILDAPTVDRTFRRDLHNTTAVNGGQWMCTGVQLKRG